MLLSRVYCRLVYVSAGSCLTFCDSTQSVATFPTLHNPQDLNRLFGVQFSGSINSGSMAANVQNGHTMLSLTCTPLCRSFFFESENCPLDSVDLSGSKSCEFRLD